MAEGNQRPLMERWGRFVIYIVIIIFLELCVCVVVFVCAVFGGLRPIWSNSQLVELLKQHKIWFSGLTDMSVGTSVVIMNRSRLVRNRLLTHKIWQIIHVLNFCK